MKDYYKVLNIEYDADIPTIKRAFRKLALKYHPDVNKEPFASERFIEITEAHEILSNIQKKQEYDKFFFSKIEDFNNQKAKEWTQYGRERAKEYASMNYEDFTNRIIDELKLGISYTPNLIFIAICIIGLVSCVYTIEKDDSLGIVLILLFGIAAYFLYDRAKRDYIAERRHKILNKYK